MLDYNQFLIVTQNLYGSVEKLASNLENVEGRCSKEANGMKDMTGGIDNEKQTKEVFAFRHDVTTTIMKHVD